MLYASVYKGEFTMDHCGNTRFMLINEVYTEKLNHVVWLCNTVILTLEDEPSVGSVQILTREFFYYLTL